MSDVRLHGFLRQEEHLADLAVHETLRDQLENLGLELSYAFARQVGLMAERVERAWLALEAEAKLEDAPLTLRQRIQRFTDALAAERLLRLVEGIRGLAICEQVTELALVVGTYR